MSPTDAIRPSVSWPTRVEEGLSDGLPARPLALRHGGGEVQQPSQPVGQPLLVHHDLAMLPRASMISSRKVTRPLSHALSAVVSNVMRCTRGVVLERLFHVGERWEPRPAAASCRRIPPAACPPSDDCSAAHRDRVAHLSCHAPVILSPRRRHALSTPSRYSARYCHGSSRHIVGQFYAACPVNNDALVIAVTTLNVTRIEGSGRRTPVSNYRPNTCAVYALPSRCWITAVKASIADRTA